MSRTLILLVQVLIVPLKTRDHRREGLHEHHQELHDMDVHVCGDLFG